MSTLPGFKEVGLYACNECDKVRVVYGVRAGDTQWIELACDSFNCGRLKRWHKPVCIDFERRQFVVPERR